MSQQKSFAVIGGDMRQIFLANSLADDNMSVTAYGFDEGTQHLRVKPSLSLADAIKNAGIIIEEPAFLGNESGRKNLELLYMLRHKRDKKRIADVMQMLGLNSESKKTVRQYSLGMRQRLALAQALMEDPDILILDEPMNGLDRDGVNEIRQLLLKLKEQGKTILLASHNKEDIEVLCDEVFEMEHGKLQQIR